VSPAVEVQLSVFRDDGNSAPFTINAQNYNERYSIELPKGSYGMHPLIEAVFDCVPVPNGQAVELSIFSEAPAGCSTGTSASVTVAVIGALDCLTPGRLSPYEVAATAHKVETELLRRQCGIQDQIAAAFGGINFIEISLYPQASVNRIILPRAAEQELEARLALIYVGVSHSSSLIHETVIRKLQDAGPHDIKLERLRGTAARSRDALYACDFVAFGRAMIENTEAQRNLQPELIGTGHQLWKIPVCLRYAAGSGDERECLLLDQPARQITSKATSCPTWMVANADADGYYRVLYQGDLLSNLLKDDARVLSGREKVALIGDMSALTGNGKLPLGTALALAPNLARDSSRRVVVKTMEITTDPKGNLVPPDLLSHYHRYLEDLYGQRARQLGWNAKPGESEDDRLLRPQILDVVANQAEDPGLVAQAKSLALAWLDDRKVIAPEMVASVLNTAARHGDRALFDRLRATAKEEKDEDIQRSLLYALGSFPQPEIAKMALLIVLTDEFDSRQSLAILRAARQSPTTRDLAYDFVKQNWDALIAKLPADFGAYMPNVASAFCDEQHRHDAAAFFEGRSTKYTGGPRNLAQTLEGIDLCVAYKKVQQPSLVEFLARYGKVD
jgi:mevalonate kinase